MVVTINLKLAFFCEDFTFNTSVAMPWRHIYEIATRLHDQGHSIHLYTNYTPGLPLTEEKNGIIVNRVKKNGPRLNIKDLSDIIDKEKFDLLSWHSGPLSALYFLQLQKYLKTKLVWNVFKGKLYAQDFLNYPSSQFLNFYQFWNNILCSLTPDYLIKKGGSIHQIGRIITLSDRIKNYFEGIGIDSEKLMTISSGVDTSSFSPLPSNTVLKRKVELGYAADDKIIVYFGPISSHRGTDTLISAMSTIKKEHPSAKLVILARTSKKDSTDDRIEQLGRKQSSIKIIKGVFGLDFLINYLDVADVVALPFRFWPYNECPLTILEAMAMEKPVISTDAGSISELVADGKTGYLVPPGDAAFLSKKISNILSNSDLATAMGKRGRKYVEQFHNWNGISKLTLNVFKEVVNAD